MEWVGVGRALFGFYVGADFRLYALSMMNASKAKASKTKNNKNPSCCIYAIYANLKEYFGNLRSYKRLCYQYTKVSR
ncbi:unnamed protein product [Lactuca virosa]|uniref:Uncharacterized protein n=1 Tax=Lactuca virosa TaxID=75947 RepID=A0AAU9MUK2_9ASTR|nr:unnamed protein product [Lactuca virosa]